MTKSRKRPVQRRPKAKKAAIKNRKFKTTNAANHNLSGRKTKALKSLSNLINIVAKLRGPDGCPWDKAQTQTTLTQYVLEEAYELAEALESRNQNLIMEELGDYLFQVILQAQVAEDEGWFSLKEVVEKINTKMIIRHPHVFSDSNAKSLEEIWKNWEKIKAQENEKKGIPKKVFSYPKNLPALQAAHKIGVKTEGYKFDWSHPEQVFEKVEEELLELRDEVFASKPNKQNLAHELGDMFFALSQLARHLDLEPEACAREANRRFEKRFTKVLELSGLEKEKFSRLSSTEKETLWQRAKKATD